MASCVHAPQCSATRNVGTSTLSISMKQTISMLHLWLQPAEMCSVLPYKGFCIDQFLPALCRL